MVNYKYSSDDNKPAFPAMQAEHLPADFYSRFQWISSFHDHPDKIWAYGLH